MLGRASDPQNRSVVDLCPNHHRCAHLLSSLFLNTGMTMDELAGFSMEHFDCAFHEQMTLPLLDWFQLGSAPEWKQLDLLTYDEAATLLDMRARVVRDDYERIVAFHQWMTETFRRAPEIPLLVQQWHPRSEKAEATQQKGR